MYKNQRPLVVIIFAIFACALGVIWLFSESNAPKPFENNYIAQQKRTQDEQDKEQNRQTNNIADKKAKDEKATAQKYYTDYHGKLNEMLDGFNNLFSNNGYSPVYTGVNYDPAASTLIVTVNDNWQYLSKDAKLGFIKASFVSWSTMAHSREIDLKLDSFHLSIIHELSGNEVASWGHIMGPNIDD